jgi:hypothetical protein
VSLRKPVAASCMATAIGSLLRAFVRGDQQGMRPMLISGRRVLTATGAKPRVTRAAPAGREEAVQKSLLFLPGQPHPGVEPAGPMLVMRNTAYPISLEERQ